MRRFNAFFANIENNADWKGFEKQGVDPDPWDGWGCFGRIRIRPELPDQNYSKIKFVNYFPIKSIIKY